MIDWTALSRLRNSVLTSLRLLGAERFPFPVWLVGLLLIVGIVGFGVVVVGVVVNVVVDAVGVAPAVGFGAVGFDESVVVLIVVSLAAVSVIAGCFSLMNNRALFSLLSVLACTDTFSCNDAVTRIVLFLCNACSILSAV